MTEAEITRESMRRVLVDTLAEMEQVLAFWEGGSAAFDRADQWSDLDVQAVVRDGSVEQVQRAAEQALRRIAPIKTRMVVPQPSWHGHWQAFYQLEGSPPYLLVDLCIMQESRGNRFLDPETHGYAVPYIDRAGIFPPSPTNAGPLAAKLAERAAALQERLLFTPFVEKELLRDRPLDALSFYQGFALLPLIEALRIRHCPWRYNFGMRYLQHDLPVGVYEQVAALAFVSDAADLAQKRIVAIDLLRRTLAELQGVDMLALLEANR